LENGILAHMGLSSAYFVLFVARVSSDKQFGTSAWFRRVFVVLASKRITQN
jgi:hypothetical protein